MITPVRKKIFADELEAPAATKSGKQVAPVMELKKFGLHSEAEWLLFAPLRFDDYAIETHNFNDLVCGTPAVMNVALKKVLFFTAQKKVTTNPVAAVRMFAVVTNRRGQDMTLTEFGRPGFTWLKIALGTNLLLRATPEMGTGDYANTMSLSSPSFVPAELFGKIVPIYGPLKKTKGEHFRRLVEEFAELIDIAGQIVESEIGWHDKNTPVPIAEVSGFASGRHLLQALHWPRSVAEGERARRAARILSAMALIRKAQLRSKTIESTVQSIVPTLAATIEKAKAALPFPLTGDQSRAVDGICASMRSPWPMDGLLSGDVGSGKTAAFLIPLVCAFLAGKRAMILTPNLLLIRQVAKEIAAYFPRVPVCTVNGKGIVGDPANSIIVGNTALFSAFAKGKLGDFPHILVIDEQHRFSVEQRNLLRTRYTNVLEATATPIPRTAAMVTHGDKDVFLLREIPVQKHIRTQIVTRDQAKAARDIVLHAVRDGEHQAAVIYPLVGAADTEKAEKVIASVRAAAEHWGKHIDPALIGVLHGKMKDEEKQAVLDDFVGGKTRLLLSSTVIEVGITVPALNTMMVVGAENMGVITLHQLRGRLVRHGGTGDFVMLAEETAGDALSRLQLLVEHENGFDLAEKDAEVRGYGDIMGTDGDAQSGKTRTLFMGVNIGPREITYAHNYYSQNNAAIVAPATPTVTAAAPSSTPLQKAAAVTVRRRFR